MPLRNGRPSGGRSSITGKDGTEFWMDIDIVPIFNLAGADAPTMWPLNAMPRRRKRTLNCWIGKRPCWKPS